MGYELNQLMKRYGLSTRTISPYSGVSAPTALASDATAAQREKFNADSAAYTQQRGAYDQYKNEFQNRIANTSAYQNSPVFKGQKQNWDTTLTTPTYSSTYVPQYSGSATPSLADEWVSAGDNAWKNTRNNNLTYGARPYVNAPVSGQEDMSYGNRKTIADPGFKFDNTGGTTTGGTTTGGTTTGGTATGGTTTGGTTTTPAASGWSNVGTDEESGYTIWRNDKNHQFISPTAPVGEEPEGSRWGVTNYGSDGEGQTWGWTPYGSGGDYAHGGAVRHFYGGGYNKVDGGIEDLVGKYDLANPTELPVAYAEANTGTKNDAGPAPAGTTYPVPANRVQAMDAASRAVGGPGVQQTPPTADVVEANPQMTTPSPVAAAPAAPATPAAPAAGTPLEALYQKYLGQQSKSAEMATAEKNVLDKKNALIELLKEQASKTEDNAPSKAEMYFRLAAALAAPTKTGGFMENVGLAAKELADFQKSTTDAKKSAAAAKLQLMLKTGEIDAQQAKEELANLKEGEKEGRALAHTFALKEYETESKKGEPQSEFGKVLKESGVQPGTPAYKEAMTDRARLETEQKGIALQAARSTEAQKIKERDQLTPKEADKAFELEKEVRIQEAALADLKKARGLSDKAYLPTWWDTAEKAVQSQIDENDPTVQATETLNRILNGATLQSAAKLKGSLSNKDLAFLEEMSGKSFKNRQSRNESIDDAMKKLEAEIAASQNDLKRVRAGEFRNKLSGESK